MRRNKNEDVLMPETDLSTVNAVTIASCAIQQLPKLMHAMSNMARRSRRQFHRRGIFLGGQWLGKKGSLHTSSSFGIDIPEENVPNQPKGILKKDKGFSLDQLSAYNDFWKSYSFSFFHEENPNDCSTNHYYSCSFPRMSNFHRPAHQDVYFSLPCENYNVHPRFPGKVCTAYMQGDLYKSQTQCFLKLFPSHMTSLDSLQSILFRHLSEMKLNPEEQEILSQLQYLKILFNTPLHKLVRERPKEFLVPLPRRHSRVAAAIVASKPYYARSLTTHQAVLTLPNPESNFKWLSLTNLTFGRNSFFGPGSDNEVGSSTKLLRYKSRSTTIVPKGVAFITYPDSVDETSFEGTIGDRNIISWERGTRFPQMGIDQSKEFTYKKEMGKQQMIQSRIRAARIYRRIYCDNWNNYVNGSKQGMRRSCAIPTKKKGFRRNKTCQRARTTDSLFKSWFKLAQLKQTLRAVNESMKNSREGGITVQSAGGRQTAAGKKAARKAERIRRIKICLMTIAKYLSCGLIPFFMKGECRFFERRHLRTVDSTERCRTPPLPLVEPFLHRSAVKTKKLAKAPP